MLPDEWRCFVVAASCPVCLRPRRLRLRRRCTLSSHSSTPSKRSNPCDVLTLARRHTAAMCVRCSSPLSSFLRCFMTEISSAASRVRLSRRRRSKLRGGRGGRGGREGGERQEQTGRPTLARPRAVRQTPPPPSLFSPPRRRSRCGGNYARAFWPFVRSKLGFLCGPFLAPPCRCHLPPLPSPPRRRPRHVFTFGPSDKPFMRSRGVDTLYRVAELIPKRSENFTNVCTGVANF